MIFRRLQREKRSKEQGNSDFLSPSENQRVFPAISRTGSSDETDGHGHVKHLSSML
jgi:hypothetical protein